MAQNPMILGGYQFAYYPHSISSLIKKERILSVVETYTSIISFSWGSTMKGKIIEMNWDWMLNSQFDSIQALYDADTAVQFVPGDGSGKQYLVEIMSFTGTFFADFQSNWRIDVNLKLIILNEGTTV